MEERMLVQIPDRNVTPDQIDEMTRAALDETKRQQREIESLDDLDDTLRRLISTNAERKKKTKKVKSSLRYLDSQL